MGHAFEASKPCERDAASTSTSTQAPTRESDHPHAMAETRVRNAAAGTSAHGTSEYPASSSMDKDAGNDYRPQARGLASDKDTCVEYKPMCHAWFDRLFLALHRDFMELDT